MNGIMCIYNDGPAEDWGLGYKGDLIFHIKEDMEFFKSTTMGKVIIYGRNTLMGFKDNKPLEGRTNIILSTNPKFKVKGATVVHSEEELLEECKKYNEEDLFVIGGAHVYKVLLNHINTFYVTKVMSMLGKEYLYDASMYNLDYYNKIWKEEVIKDIRKDYKDDTLWLRFSIYRKTNTKDQLDYQELIKFDLAKAMIKDITKEN